MAVLLKCALLLSAVAVATSFNLGPNDVIFHLLTRNNPEVSQPMLPSTNSIMTATMFSLQRKTVFTIHSFGETVSDNFNAFLINAHLAAEDVNLIAVDWSLGSSMYTQGLASAAQVGEVIASFIDILTGVFSYSQEIRIVGHGLGGHIAGIAARSANVDISHIVALDPSFHGWSHNPNILTPNDATVVEVLHTAIGTNGYDYPLGTIDFYANGGAFQPICFIDTKCAHDYAYVYYAESLTAEVNDGNSFAGTSCESYEEAITFSCSGTKDVTFGGTATKTSDTSGIYTFNTNFIPPFAQG